MISNSPMKRSDDTPANVDRNPFSFVLKIASILIVEYSISHRFIFNIWQCYSNEMYRPYLVLTGMDLPCCFTTQRIDEITSIFHWFDDESVQKMHRIINFWFKNRLIYCEALTRDKLFSSKTRSAFVSAIDINPMYTLIWIWCDFCAEHQALCPSYTSSSPSTTSIASIGN